MYRTLTTHMPSLTGNPFSPGAKTVANVCRLQASDLHACGRKNEVSTLSI